VAKSLAGLYGIIGQPAHGVGPLVVAGAIAAGVASSVLAAVFPAAAAARADPVRALQKGRYQMVPLAERRTRRLLACAATSMAALLLAGRIESWFVVSYVLAALALVLLTPELSSAAVRLLRPLLVRLRPVEGALAADSLLAAPRRTASVAAALMLSAGMVIALGGIAEASYQSILDWVTGTLDADFLVAPSENLKDLTLRFPGTMERDFAAVEGLAVVQPVRTARVAVRNSQPILFAVDIPRLTPQARRRAIPVDTERVHQLAAQGRGVIVSDNFAARERVRVGDSLDLPAPDGALRLPVLGIYKDFTIRRAPSRSTARFTAAAGTMTPSTSSVSTSAPALPRKPFERRLWRAWVRTEACLCSRARICAATFWAWRGAGSRLPVCSLRSRCWWRFWA
jgi:putative ABC transport system permease protein